MFQTPEQLLQHMHQENIDFLDVRFVDVPGQEHHFTLPLRHLTPEVLQAGIAFDGSSVKGFRDIDKSDLLLVPELDTACLDPFSKHKTLMVTCHVVEPETGLPYQRDPRTIARNAEAYLRSTGIADTVQFGPEVEFFVLDSVGYAVTPYSSFFEVNAPGTVWTTRTQGDGYHLPPKAGYAPLPPADRYSDLRSDMVKHLESLGIPIEVHQHEVASAGQMEINMRFAPLLTSAEQVLRYKYVVKNTAFKAGKTATFMPKPFYGDNGSGMHCHQSLWKEGEPLFYDPEGYAELSELAMSYAAGLLYHGPALSALTNPSVNSYRRLVPGYEAPVNLVISAGNRSAVVRIPAFYKGPQYAHDKRIEYRAPDPSANPYLAFSAILMAGLDGIRQGMKPPTPMDKNVYSLSARESRRIKTLPRTLDEALDELESDDEFLRVGDVFTKDFLDTWIDLKREEAEAFRMQTTPKEFEMYYNT